MWPTYLIATVLAYLIGAIPTGYIVVKRLTGQDVRTFGSGGTGATNVKRVAGNKAALFVLFFDFHKGLVPVILSKTFFPTEDWLHVLVALATVIGHSKSVFLNFSGGKSAATGLGGMMGLAAIPALLIALIAFSVTRLSRFVSLGSITASLCAPVILYLSGQPKPYIIYTCVSAGYVIWLHKTNIGRLLSGTENRI